MLTFILKTTLTRGERFKKKANKKKKMKSQKLAKTIETEMHKISLNMKEKSVKQNAKQAAVSITKSISVLFKSYAEKQQIHFIAIQYA